MAQYNAEISAGSLLPLESRRVAALLLTHPDDTAFAHAVEVDNILQKRSPATARRQARLIRRRLERLDVEAWQMIADREAEVVVQLLLVSAVKHSPLFGEFLREVYALRQRRLEATLNPTDWPDFLAQCAHHDPAIENWSESTRAKLFQVIVRMLVESKYLDTARSMKLTPRSLHPDVRRYLQQRNDTYVLECLERAA
jgi:hypothetical protein